MDSIFEYAGAQAATSLYETMSALGLPLLVACAGIAWRVHRVAEDGVVRPLAMYVLSLLLLAWLIRPVPVIEEVRLPRFLALIGGGADLAVKGSIARLNSDFLTKPFEYERVAAMAGQARVADPALREELAVFFAACTPNAMAEGGPISERAAQNPLAADSGLPYAPFIHPRSGENCDVVRRRLFEAVNAELDRDPRHRSVLNAVGESSREAYMSVVIRNEWFGRVADSGEMAAVRRSVGRYEDRLDKELEQATSPAVTGIPFAEGMIDDREIILRIATSSFAKFGQSFSDSVTSRQRYYLVTAHAPVLYGLILMLLTALFPIAAMWSLFPGRWMALLNYGKVFISVKMWPVGWALISTFTAKRPLAEALTEDARAGDVFVASTLLYFLIPGLSFLVIHLGTAAAAIPFKEAAPAVAGPSNGPVGDAARMAVQRMR